MIAIGIGLVAVGVILSIVGLWSSNPPFSEMGVPGVIVAVAGLAILYWQGIDLRDYLPSDSGGR